MRIYHFEYYSPDFGWRRHFSPTKEAVIIDRGEYVKYAEEEDWVKGWWFTDLKPDAESICEMINKLNEEDAP